MKTATFPAVVEARKAASEKQSYYRDMMAAAKAAAPVGARGGQAPQGAQGAAPKVK